MTNLLDSAPELFVRRRQIRTKTIATVGPASESPHMLEQLARAGVDIFRINMAHGNRDVHDTLVERIRGVSVRLDCPLGILVDLAGPKIRLGELFEPLVECDVGQRFVFVRGERAPRANTLVSNYEPLIDELAPGNMVMLADGAVAMQAVAKEPDAVTCEVLSGGEIRSRQGINLPGVPLSAHALTPEDRENVRWAIDREIDFLGMSFVRNAGEVKQLKQLLTDGASTALVIAKIEKREALDSLEAIVSEADGVMVARGDLGVETDIAETPVIQKRIIDLCNRYMKPVIVATQMLDSMERSSRPTRAEVSDVANAILDGADACMLSGETAIGLYPLAAVHMMNRVMEATERVLPGESRSGPPVAERSDVHAVTEAVVHGASLIASRLSARLVVVATRTGGTARVKSKHRDFIPTVGVSDSESTLRRMNLFWGIIPLRGAPVHEGPALRRFIEDWGMQHQILHSGDRIVFVTGTHFVPFAHNVLVVHECPAREARESSG
jgi:pyruvate kinase